uniref:Uncharacterized protein n=1 Tax=Strigamia maritima TaxID=126957 RepID=T1JN12_STRMM
MVLVDIVPCPGEEIVLLASFNSFNTPENIVVSSQEIFFLVFSVLAMEALHRQVLPFILRRLKDDVNLMVLLKFNRFARNILASYSQDVIDSLSRLNKPIYSLILLILFHCTVEFSASNNLSKSLNLVITLPTYVEVGPPIGLAFTLVKVTQVVYTLDELGLSAKM